MAGRRTPPRVRHRIRAGLAFVVLTGTALIVGCDASVVVPPTTAIGSEASRAVGSPDATPRATVKSAFKPTGETQAAKVARIVDGDTIVVSIGGKNVKVRYIGMDTPEDVDPNKPVEPMSREAAAANEALVSGKTVVLEKDVSETDRYGRLLRYVWLHQGTTWTLVNLELVRRGFARAVSYPPDVKDDEVFASAEGAARSSHVGLWAPGASAAPEATPRRTPKPTP